MMMMNVMLKMLLINISASILEEYQNLSVTLCVTQQSYASLNNLARMWMSLIILTYFVHQNFGEIVEWRIKLLSVNQYWVFWLAHFFVGMALAVLVSSAFGMDGLFQMRWIIWHFR